MTDDPDDIRRRLAASVDQARAGERAPGTGADAVRDALDETLDRRPLTEQEKEAFRAAGVEPDEPEMGDDEWHERVAAHNALIERVQRFLTDLDELYARHGLWLDTGGMDGLVRISDEQEEFGGYLARRIDDGPPILGSHGPGFATGREMHARLARSGPPLEITNKGLKPRHQPRLPIAGSDG